MTVKTGQRKLSFDILRLDYVQSIECTANMYFDNQHQMTKEYYKSYLEVTEPMFIKPREFEFVNRMAARWT